MAEAGAVTARGLIPLSESTPDLGDEAVRRRLGPARLTGFRNIVEVWGATGGEAR
jgi:hypothetical protein